LRHAKNFNPKWFRIYIDILLILEPKKCCSKIRLTGARLNKYNKNYIKQKELLNGMPYYIDKQRRFAIWAEANHYEIGYLSYREYGIMGDFYNEEFVECPTDGVSNDWREWVDRKWTINFNLKLSCTKDMN